MTAGSDPAEIDRAKAEILDQLGELATEADAEAWLSGERMADEMSEVVRVRGAKLGSSLTQFSEGQGTTIG